MPIDHSTRLPLSTWDHETLREVAVAYRRMRWLGERDLPARRDAQAAYRDRHPNVTDAEARDTVTLMIAAVARDHPRWLWDGVGAVSRSR